MTHDKIKNSAEEKLLNLPINSFELSLRHSAFLYPLVKQVFYELENKGFFLFKPHVYLGDEWFSPSGEPAISIPFYLAHPKLKKLEKKHTGEAEGETRSWCLALLRHEIGHCFDHAYGLSKTPLWVKTFGNPRKKYDPDHYSYDPKSKDFVTNLEDYYAQAHPEEDFAETFAVWLEKPKKAWEKEYKLKPKALKKLYYVDKVLTNLEDKSISVSSKNLISKASKLRIFLKTYYHRKRRQMTA